MASDNKTKVPLTNQQMKELLLSQLIKLNENLEIISGQWLYTRGFQSRNIALVANVSAPIIQAAQAGWYIITNPNRLQVGQDFSVSIGHKGVTLLSGTPLFESLNMQIYVTENTEIHAIVSQSLNIKVIEL